MATNGSRRRTVLAFLAVFLVLAGCGGGSGVDGGADPDEGSRPDWACGSVAKIHELRKEVGDSIDLATLDAAIEEEKDLLGGVKGYGPTRVREALNTVDRYDPDTVVIADKRAYVEATETLDDWVATECGLDVRLY